MAKSGVWMYDPIEDMVVPKGEYLRRKYERHAAKRSALAGPTVIGTMPAIKSMVDGKMYDDKSSYYRSVERAGCAIVGFEKDGGRSTAQVPTYDERAHTADLVSDVKKSIEQVSSL